MSQICLDVPTGLEWIITAIASIISLAWTAYQEYRHRKEAREEIEPIIAPPEPPVIKQPPTMMA